MTIRAATPAERLYAYDQSTQIARQCGSPGYLWGELDNTGTVFINSWETCVRSQNTPEFKAEFNTVLDMLRFDERYGGILKNRASMIVYCLDHPQGRFRNGFEYAFRADTQDYSYLIRCIPAGEDNHVYIHPYRRNRLDQHMKQAEKGIRFITLDYKEKFRIPDGDNIRIITSEGDFFDHTARYIDECHVEVGNNLYHICEFAERLERSNSKVIPLRSTLPERCFSVTTMVDKMVVLTKGEMGYRIASVKAEGVTSREGATTANEAMGVTKAQEAAMLAGSMFGWDTPAADPKNYDEQGKPIKPRHHDRGDAR